MPTEAADTARPASNRDLREIFRHLQPPVAPLLLASALLFMDALAGLSAPLIVGHATAHILDTPEAGNIGLDVLLLLWMALIVIQSAVRYFSTQHLGQTAASLGAHLRLQTYEHVQALPVSFFQNRAHGDILSLLSEDISRISHFLTTTTAEFAPHLLLVLGSTFIVLGIDPLTGLIALFVMPISLFTIRMTGRAANPLSAKLANQQATHTSLTEENLRLNQLIKAFTREPTELRRYQQSNRALLDTEIQHLRVSNRITPIVHAITSIAIVFLVWLGATRIENGAMQASELVSLIMYGFILFRPLHSLGRTYGGYQTALGAASRLASLLREQREPAEDGGLVFSQLKDGIRFHNVSFSYPGRPSTFQDFSTALKAGKITAISGENGAGKTTLLHLLLRFLEPDSGRITIDGTDLREFSLDSLRSNIGYVPQHVTLVNGTIEENIRYGLADADDRMLEACAEAAHVNEFVNKLPHRLQTHVGPGGHKLSGGQKQRIALARALMKDADILILDEPTAMFDLRSEKELLAKLEKPLAGKTVILVTHRSTLLEIADEVITIDGYPVEHELVSH